MHDSMLFFAQNGIYGIGNVTKKIMSIVYHYDIQAWSAQLVFLKMQNNVDFPASLLECFQCTPTHSARDMTTRHLSRP